MPPCILLCDDEVHILRAAEFKFQRAGFDVVTAADGEAAWQAIQQRKPDIVVSDYQMPRLDGFGLVQRLRSQPETADLPIILLTAKGFELSHEELRGRWNVAAVLAKPFSPKELLARVEQVLASRGDWPPADGPAPTQGSATGGSPAPLPVSLATENRPSSLVAPIPEVQGR